MIVGQLENWKNTQGTGRLAKGFHFLEKAARQDFEDGRHLIDEERVFASIASYTTRPLDACRFEAHRRYIDIQYLLRGREYIFAAPVSELQPLDPFSESRDAGFYSSTSTCHRLLMVPGTFAVFFPEDAHMPGVAIEEAEEVRKVVVKIEVSLLS